MPLVPLRFLASTASPPHWQSITGPENEKRRSAVAPVVRSVAAQELWASAVNLQKKTAPFPVPISPCVPLINMTGHFCHPAHSVRRHRQFEHEELVNEAVYSIPLPLTKLP